MTVNCHIIFGLINTFFQLFMQGIEGTVKTVNKLGLYFINGKSVYRPVISINHVTTSRGGERC